MPLDGFNYRPEPDEPEAVRVLRAAKALIQDPEDWFQGRVRAQTDAFRVNRLPGRTRNCAFTAIRKVGGLISAGDYLNQAAVEMGHIGMAALNNTTDHPTVMAMFDRAIEIALEAAQETIKS